jgi:release factor glutamine methyltransferase
MSQPDRPLPSPAPTLQEALAWAAARLGGASGSPRLDAEALLLQLLGRDRAYLRAWPERRLDAEAAERFQHWIEQRALGVPVAYLTGEREFWSRPFQVTEGVLIPRPETELLIEQALAWVEAGQAAAILDLGTGSGIIAVTLALERPSARVTAIDLSPAALAVARDNARQLGAAGLRFLEGDWCAPLAAGERFDLIVSNPPYIAAQDPHLRQGDLRFEPVLALTAGPDGLAALRAIAGMARERLNRGGRLLLEHGYDQADALGALLASLGYREIAHHRDLQGHRRATSARQP